MESDLVLFGWNPNSQSLALGVNYYFQYKPNNHNMRSEEVNFPSYLNAPNCNLRLALLQVSTGLIYITLKIYCRRSHDPLNTPRGSRTLNCWLSV